MESQYDKKEWEAATTLGRRVFNYNFRMTGSELKGWELVNTAIMQDTAGLNERVYLWEKTGSKGHEMIRVSIAELNEWRSAQNHLHEQLRHSMRPNIPRASGKQAKTGDVSFVGQESDSKIVQALSFTRGNLSVTVSSVGDKPVDVTNVASMLDRMFSEPPQKDQIKKGTAKILAPEPLTAQKDKPVTVIERLPEAVPRSGWLKIIVPDGELSRQDDNVIYRADKAGKKLIGKYAIPQ